MNAKSKVAILVSVLGATATASLPASADTATGTQAAQQSTTTAAPSALDRVIAAIASMFCPPVPN